jgi:hypothetical protein
MSVEGQMPSISRQLPAEVPRWKAADYEGAYTSPELGVTWRIESSGRNLMLRDHNTETLSILDKDEFSSSLGLIHFLRNKDGRINAFTVTNVRDTGIEFRRSLN